MFNEIINFIITNYQLFVVAISFIIFVLSIILRKGKNILIDNSASSKLIDLIQEAEKKFGSGHGEDKLSYVICKYFDYMKIPAADQHWLYIIVKDLIEKILSTPQKKK